MKIIEEYHNRVIDNALIALNKEKEGKHVRSGKLSASKLGWALQWQVLNGLGINNGGEIDPYTLRKFQRGNDVEDRVLSFFPDAERQKEVEYRDVVGFVDVFSDTKDWDFPCGTIPTEVKSVTTLKWKHLNKNGEPQRSHIYQACLYALATDSSHFAVMYVSADDYRIKTFLFETSEYKAEVDAIIDRYQKCMEDKYIPRFEATEPWHDKIMYSPYPEFVNLSPEESLERVKEFWVEKLSKVTE